MRLYLIVVRRVIFGSHHCRRSRLLEPAHSRSRDHVSSGRIAGLLRRPRPVSLREAAPPVEAGELRRVQGPPCSRRGLRRRHRPRPVRQRGSHRIRRRPVLVGHRAGAANFAQQGLQADLRDPDFEHLPLRLRVRSRVRARGGSVHERSQGAGGRVPPRAEPWRRGRLPGLQPRVVAERVVEADEGPARARGRSGARQIQRRGVPRAVERLPRHPGRGGALSREVPAARRLERPAVQHVLRRNLQRAAPAAGAAVRGHLLAFCRK